MTIHATARTEFARARLMSYIAGLTLTGSPQITDAEEPHQAADAAPWVRVTFDEALPINAGRYGATTSAVRMAYLVVVDIFWPTTEQQATVDIYAADRVASEVREALLFLKLSYLDYTVPAAPVAVTDVALFCKNPPTVRRIPDDSWRRRRVQAVVEWVAIYDDFTA